MGNVFVSGKSNGVWGHFKAGKTQSQMQLNIICKLPNQINVPLLEIVNLMKDILCYTRFILFEREALGAFFCDYILNQSNILTLVNEEFEECAYLLNLNSIVESTTV